MAKTKEVKSAYEYEYKKDYQSDWSVHKNYVDQNFDAWEAMLTGTVYDSVSKTIDGSKITDSYAMTLAKERADRVIAKLPEGLVEPIGKADMGKAAFMDILRQKWIYPNANSQHPFLEKLNMWQFYSSVYGYMPMFYDWNVSSTGYAGPDCWLWSPRNLIPQQGRSSIADMEYVTALTWVNKSYIEGIIEDAAPADKSEDEAEGESDENPTLQDGWDIPALKELLTKDESRSPVDSSQDSQVKREREQSGEKRGICLATRYEAGEDGEWVTFAPDHGYCEVRRLKNPHKNGRIPFVIKYSQPLFDSFYGLGDFQRAKSLQYARDGLTNFYFSGIKMNLIPPIVANANGVVKHTLDYRPGGVILETMPNSVRRLETSNAGLSTYQAAQTSLTAALLSQYGTQNASIPGADALNPSQGKTPAAVGLYSDKEATRDGAERRHLEAAVEQLTEGMFSLVVNIGTEKIPVALFKEDIRDIMKSGLTDIQGLFTQKNVKKGEDGLSGKLTVDPKSLKGVEYRFKINADSTAKINQQAQLQSLDNYMDRIGKMQNLFQDDPTITIHWDRIAEVFSTLTDIPGASEFITIDPSAQKPQEQPAPPQPSATALSLQSGQVHESADLVKLYQVCNDPSVKMQILQTMGFHPSMPDLSSDQINAISPQPTAPVAPQPVPQPAVSASGHSFNDPHLAEVANALHEHAKPLTSKPIEPKPVVNTK